MRAGETECNQSCAELRKRGKRSEEHTSELKSHSDGVCRHLLDTMKQATILLGGVGGLRRSDGLNRCGRDGMYSKLRGVARARKKRVDKTLASHEVSLRIVPVSCFPYTTLFRSPRRCRRLEEVGRLE